MICPVGKKCLIDVLVSTTILFSTGGQDGPNAFPPVLTIRSPRALGDMSINDNLANLTFCPIVRGLYVGFGKKRKVVICLILLEPSG